MALGAIATMFSAAARTAAKGSQAMLSKAGPTGARSLRAISKQAAPTLKKGFKFSRNIGRQSLKVLRKKERLAGTVYKMSKNFWKWGNKRVTAVKGRLEQLKRESGGEGSREAAVLADEQHWLFMEQRAFQSLQADENAVLKAFKQRRKHDLRPLLKKSNHAAKLAAWEDKAGAVDPNVLREYGAYELRLLRDIQAQGKWGRQIEEDEFKTMDMLRFSLIREYRDLGLQLIQETNPRIRAIIKRNMTKVEVEIYMLQNAKLLAEKGDQQEKQLRNKSSRIYNLISWLTKVEQKEDSIMRGSNNQGFRPAFAR